MPSLSRSTRGRPVRAASALARVDLPLPAQPAITTRSTSTTVPHWPAACISREPIWPTVSCGRQPASAVCSVHNAEEGAVWGGDQQASDVMLVHPLAGGVEDHVGSLRGAAGLHRLGSRGLPAACRRRGP